MTHAGTKPRSSFSVGRLYPSRVSVAPNYLSPATGPDFSAVLPLSRVRLTLTHNCLPGRARALVSAWPSSRTLAFSAALTRFLPSGRARACIVAVLAALARVSLPSWPRSRVSSPFWPHSRASLPFLPRSRNFHLVALTHSLPSGRAHAFLGRMAYARAFLAVWPRLRILSFSRARAFFAIVGCARALLGC